MQWHRTEPPVTVFEHGGATTCSSTALTPPGTVLGRSGVTICNSTALSHSARNVPRNVGILLQDEVVRKLIDHSNILFTAVQSHPSSCNSSPCFVNFISAYSGVSVCLHLLTCAYGCFGFPRQNKHSRAVVQFLSACLLLTRVSGCVPGRTKLRRTATTTRSTRTSRTSSSPWPRCAVAYSGNPYGQSLLQL